MRYLGQIAINCAMTLQELAALLSDRCFAGIPFAGKHDNIREETPAVFIALPYLGLHAVLAGADGHYGLSIEVWDDNCFRASSFPELDLSVYLVDSLGRIPNLGVSLVEDDVVDEFE